MYPVIHINCNLKNQYDSYNFFTRIKDRFNTSLIGESKIKDVGVKVIHVKIPSNFNKKAYLKNIENSKKLIRSRKVTVSPKTLRLYDYEILNSFQKGLISFGVVKTAQLILRLNNKSIKNGCILMFDPLNPINKDVLYELSKYAAYIVLVDDGQKKLQDTRDYIVANYGIAPVITRDIEYALKEADFIISTKEIKASIKSPIWYLDNNIKAENNNQVLINDINYKVPWNTELANMSPELLGGILGQMGEKDICKSLRSNGIYLDEIKFNEKIIELT